VKRQAHTAEKPAFVRRSLSRLLVWLLVGLLVIGGLAALLLAVGWQRLLARLAPLRDPEAAKAAGEDLIDNASTVVAIGAHPDDIEWWCGGTLARLHARGKTVIVVIATDTKGIADVRRSEQMAAARILGYDRVIFLGYPDRGLADVPFESLVERVREVLSKASADTVVTFDAERPSYIYRHPDHMRIGQAALEAARRFRVPRIYGFHTSSPDVVVDIEPVLSAKLEAIAVHRSQHNYPRIVRFLVPGAENGDDAAREQLRRQSAAEGARAGLTYAESFRQIR
jgi:LmbE family N-acetylglucosaminyl deacetylase